jgi:hypothetical protein
VSRPAPGEHGAAAVELAILLPLLVTLLFGTVQLGLAFERRIQATGAAHQAARRAVVGVDDWADVGGSGTGLWELVREEAGVDGIANCSLTVSDRSVGATLTVAFDYPVDLAVPFLPIPASWRQATARASMRVEQLSDPTGPGGC